VAEIDTDDDNVVPIDKQNHAKPRRKFRKVVVKDSEDGQFYYVAQGRNGEPLYTSETFTTRADAVRAARREHEGRNEKFDYLLEYTNAKGNTIKETL
jgi:uncharacterized protein YegP (UPF0339 family)